MIMSFILLLINELSFPQGSRINFRSTSKHAVKACSDANTRCHIRDELSREIWLAQSLKNIHCVFNCVTDADHNFYKDNDKFENCYVHRMFDCDNVAYVLFMLNRCRAERPHRQRPGVSSQCQGTRNMEKS